MDSNLPLARVVDVPEGKGIVVLGSHGDEIALFKIDGKIYAINNSCPHEGGPLGEGKVEGCTVTCPLHAWEFNVKTGSCINIPGADVDKIRITVTDGMIYLES